MLVLGGGGGGCASPKTLIFYPEFLLQSIFSLKMTTTKNPQEHHHFTVFAALETIIFKIYVQSVSPSIATHGPRPIYWGSWKQNVSSALRVYSWPACQPYASYKSAPERQRPPISCLSLLRSSTFARLSMLWSPAISCSTCSKAPIFHFAVAQTYHNLGQGPSPSTLMLACKFWIKTCFGKNNNSYSIMLSLCNAGLCWCIMLCVCVGGGGGVACFAGRKGHMCKTYISQCPPFLDLCSSWDSYL